MFNFAKKYLIIFTFILINNLVFASKDVAFGIHLPLTTLDNYNGSYSVGYAVGKSYYEGLFEFDQNYKIHNKLALSYEVSKDGLSYIFKLRPNVKFHDGTEFNAEAVKINFERVSNPENKLARYNQFNMIKNCEVLDNLTVRINLKQPFSAFINTISHPVAVMISPTALKKYGKDIAFNPVGTGPFEFVEWKQSEYVKVKKNPNYWIKGKPKIDNLIFKIITDNNTRINAIQTGEIQFAFPLPYELAKSEKLIKNNNLEVLNHNNSIAIRYISINTLKKPFDNIKIRKALNYAINKEALSKVVFNGFANPLNGLVTSNIDYAHKINSYPYDLKKAKQLLKEAGFENGFKTKIWSAYNDTTSNKVIQFIQQQLAQIGVKLEVEITDPASSNAQVIQIQNPKDAKVELYYSGWSPAVGTVDWLLRPMFATSSFPPESQNTAYYSNKEVDEAIKIALLSQDEKEKTQLYKKAQEIVFDEVPWIFLVTPQNIYIKSKKLTGVFVSPDTGFYYNDIDLVE